MPDILGSAQPDLELDLKALRNETYDMLNPVISAYKEPIRVGTAEMRKECSASFVSMTEEAVFSQRSQFPSGINYRSRRLVAWLLG